MLSDFEIRQDTLVRLQAKQSQSLRLNLPVEKPQINLKRAQEIIEQSEQREQTIVRQQQYQQVSVHTVDKSVLKPSIVVDSLMAAYHSIGCSPHVGFPDTFSLTILERYYQPSIPESAASGSTQPDSLQVAVADTPVYPVDRFAGDVRMSTYPSAVTLFIMCGLVLLTCIKFRFGKNILQAFQSFFSYQQALRMYEERRESDRQAALLTNILFAFNVGLFISLALPFFEVSLLWKNLPLSIVCLSLSVCLLYMIKAGVWKILGVVFMIQSFSRTYICNMFLYNRNTGLFVSPFVTLIPYVADTVVPYIIYGVMALFAVSYLLRMRRIFQIIHAQNTPIYYFILYLCTLEILPLLLFAKSCKVFTNHLMM